MKQIKQDQDKREEELFKQTEQLVQVVEDQTQTLREKDRQLEQLLLVEQRYAEMVLSNNHTSSDTKNEGELKELLEK